MTDGVGLTKQGLNAPSRSRTLYQSEGVHEVQGRAKFLEQAQSPQEQAGLKRLNRLLDGGTDFNREAPRGFYLNIRV